MVFFGLVERQQESQVLFEKAFGIHFNIQLKVDPNTHVDVHAEHSEAETEDEIDAIKKLNHLVSSVIQSVLQGTSLRSLALSCNFLKYNH